MSGVYTYISCLKRNEPFSHDPHSSVENWCSIYRTFEPRNPSSRDKRIGKSQSLTVHPQTKVMSSFCSGQKEDHRNLRVPFPNDTYTQWNKALLKGYQPPWSQKKCLTSSGGLVALEGIPQICVREVLNAKENKSCFFWWKKTWMDVSKNRGTPKWMVYNGKSY